MAPKVGWLCVGGIEVIHDARTLTYLHNGLAGGPLGASVAVFTSGEHTTTVELPYEDVYTDDYGEPFTVDCADGFAPVCLECACESLTILDDFVDPATDDAPWYQATSPQSADFLGFVATAIDVPPQISRSQQPRERFGGTPTPTQLLPRIIQVTAQMYAATDAGMEWGQRWLTDVLVGACEGGADVTYLPYCPEDTLAMEEVYRVLADSILVDAPTFTDGPGFREFFTGQVRFQMESVAPWILGVPVECDSDNLFPGESLNCLIETPDWGGSQAIRLEATGQIDGLTLRAVPLAADQPCPVDGTGMPCSEFTVDGTQEGDILIVDAGRRTALLTDITSKNDVSAIPYLDFDGPFPWVEAPPCTRLCVTVTNNGAGVAEVTLFTVLREL